MTAGEQGVEPVPVDARAAAHVVAAVAFQRRRVATDELLGPIGWALEARIRLDLGQDVEGVPRLLRRAVVEMARVLAVLEERS